MYTPIACISISVTWWWYTACYWCVDLVSFGKGTSEVEEWAPLPSFLISFIRKLALGTCEPDRPTHKFWIEQGKKKTIARFPWKRKQSEFSVPTWKLQIHLGHTLRNQNPGLCLNFQQSWQTKEEKNFSTTFSPWLFSKTSAWWRMSRRLLFWIWLHFSCSFEIDCQTFW